MPNAIIKGGTRSGWRRPRPAGKAWDCCGEPLGGYLPKCPRCANPRPN